MLQFAAGAAAPSCSRWCYWRADAYRIDGKRKMETFDTYSEAKEAGDIYS